MKKRMFAFLLGALLGVSFIAGATPPENAGWTTEAKTAFETAKEKKLPVLAFFTGSDWCPFCVKMAKETLPTKEFRDFAKDKLVLLYLDFPRSKAPSKEAQELQTELASAQETLDAAQANLEQLESSESSLEESFRWFEKGMKLVKSCSDQIDQVEKKIIVLSEGEDNAGI